MKHLLLVFILSCSSMHLRLKSEYQTQDNQQGSVVFEKSYETKTVMWSCILTGIFYGGACWIYTMMPMVAQENTFVQDAEQALREKLGVSNVKLQKVEVVRHSWSDQSTNLIVNPYANSAPPSLEPQKAIVPKNTPRQNTDTESKDDFLR